MKRALTLITLIFLISCKNDCPKCPDPVQCPERGSAEACPPELVCPSCIEAFRFYTENYWDSVRSAAIYQVDTIRANMLAERDRIVSFLDSMVGTKIYDNMYIYADTLVGHEAKAYFDSITNKPILIIK